MKLNKITTIKTSDNTFMEFITGAMINSSEYHYNIEVSKSPKEYTIDIFEEEDNKDKSKITNTEDISEEAKSLISSYKCPICGKLYRSLTQLGNDCIAININSDKGITFTCNCGYNIHIDRDNYIKGDYFNE